VTRLDLRTEHTGRSKQEQRPKRAQTCLREDRGNPSFPLHSVAQLSRPTMTCGTSINRRRSLLVRAEGEEINRPAMWRIPEKITPVKNEQECGFSQHRHTVYRTSRGSDSIFCNRPWTHRGGRQSASLSSRISMTKPSRRTRLSLAYVVLVCGTSLCAISMTCGPLMVLNVPSKSSSMSASSLPFATGVIGLFFENKKHPTRVHPILVSCASSRLSEDDPARRPPV